MRGITAAWLAATVGVAGTAPAAADCIVAPGLPGSGLVMSCDGDPPNVLVAPIVTTSQPDSIFLGSGAGMDTAGPVAIVLLEGDDALGLIGIDGPDDVIDHRDGTSTAVQLGTNGVKTVRVEGKRILSAAGGIDAGAGASTTLDVSGATLTTVLEAFLGGSGDDVVTIVDSTIESTGHPVAVGGGGGDDVITVGEGAAVEGRIEGDGGHDELVFAHRLDPATCGVLAAELAAADPAAGSIEIDGLVYEWAELEALTPAFECALVEIPTSSPGGIALLALLLAACGARALRLRA